MLREIAFKYLREHQARAGETIQIGWHVLRITDGAEGLDVESLDFLQMASFTTDFRIADLIRLAQEDTLHRQAVEAEDSNLMQSAVVSRSYLPLSPFAFIERSTAANGHDSGWYVGMTEEPLNLEDSDSFVLRSLYELTIHDERLAPWWLMPVGCRILLSGEEPTVTKVNACA